MIRSTLCAAIVVFSLTPLFSTAEQTSRMLVFLEQAGLREQFEALRTAREEMARDQMRQMLSQLRTGLPEIPPGHMDEFEAISRQLVASMSDAYSIDEVLRVYAAPFDRNYPGSDLDAAIGELSTPEGQRFLLTANEATNAVVAFTTRREQEVMNRATQEYMEGVDRLLDGMMPR